MTITFYKKFHNPSSPKLLRQHPHCLVDKNVLLRFCNSYKDTHRESNTRKTIKVCFFLLQFGYNGLFYVFLLGPQFTISVTSVVMLTGLPHADRAKHYDHLCKYFFKILTTADWGQPIRAAVFGDALILLSSCHNFIISLYLPIFPASNTAIFTKKKEKKKHLLPNICI